MRFTVTNLLFFLFLLNSELSFSAGGVDVGNGGTYIAKKVHYNVPSFKSEAELLSKVADLTPRLLNLEDDKLKEWIKLGECDQEKVKLDHVEVETVYPYNKYFSADNKMFTGKILFNLYNCKAEENIKDDLLE